jgi:DNA-binding XRE family transcriptional regulator
MSAVTKRHPTKFLSNRAIILRFVYEGHIYHIPKSVADKYEAKMDVPDRISPEALFTPLQKKYTKPGVLLRGTRHREGLTQLEMAKKLKITQADLSKMENGKRSIGKTLAKRIENKFGVDYRYFL